MASKNNLASKVTPDKIIENHHRTKASVHLFLHRSIVLNHFCS